MGDMKKEVLEVWFWQWNVSPWSKQSYRGKQSTSNRKPKSYRKKMSRATNIRKVLGVSIWECDLSSYMFSLHCGFLLPSLNTDVKG